MKAIDVVQGLWQERGASDPEWFKRGYEAAAAKVEDNTSDLSDEEFRGWDYGSHYVVLGEGFVSDEFSKVTPDELRAHAYGLLVLADIAQAQGQGGS